MEVKGRKLFTLRLPIRDRKMLLGMKKRGLGVGRWDGFGGKVEQGETLEEAAVRELEEEVGIKASLISYAGLVQIDFRDVPKAFDIHIFFVPEFSGDIRESDEMRPEWFSFDEIPFPHMWPNDVYWIPLFLEGKRFNARFYLENPDTGIVLQHEVKEVL